MSWNDILALQQDGQDIESKEIDILRPQSISSKRFRIRDWWLKTKTEVRLKLLGDKTKTAIKDEIDGIEMMTEEDFDRLIVMIKGLRRIVLEGSKTSYRCSRVPRVLGAISRRLKSLTMCKLSTFSVQKIMIDNN